MSEFIGNIKHKDVNYIRVGLKLLILQYYERLD